ncbi:Pentatricopeptide repeat-containing protein [Acorus gramineus]|uniref:Pentatricopeptide repeat-containing protein n=1 Tax=Acorus gramineus TaxID=55184 RepID=A0AAV9BU90_ACOGR|nr:Pentatricopeptide repeat-containing protein [Acorus gramineus]
MPFPLPLSKGQNRNLLPLLLLLRPFSAPAPNYENPPLPDSLFESPPRAGPHTLGDSTFHNMVLSYADAGDLRSLDLLLDRMRRDRRSLGETLLVRVVKAYGKARRVDDALDLFDGLSEEFHIRRTVRSFNSALNVLVAEGLVDRALGFYARFREEGVSPNGLTFNLLIKVLCRSGSVDRATEVFRGMYGHGCTPDVFAYGTLMDGLCREGRTDEAVALLDEMHVEGVLPSVVVYNVLVRRLCLDGDFARVSRLVDNMHLKGCAPNEATYNTIIHGLCLKGRVEKAVGILERMVSNGCRPNEVTYGTIIDGLVKQNRASDAIKVLSLMEEKGLKANEFVYSSLVSGLFKAGNSKLAMEIWRQMEENGCKANIVVYTALVDGLCRGGDIEEAKRVLLEMSEKGFKPNVFTYSALMRGLFETGKTEDAIGVWNDMIDNGCTPSKSLEDKNPREFLDGLVERLCRRKNYRDRWGKKFSDLYLAMDAIVLSDYVGKMNTSLLDNGSSNVMRALNVAYSSQLASKMQLFSPAPQSDCHDTRRLSYEIPDKGENTSCLFPPERDLICIETFQPNSCEGGQINALQVFNSEEKQMELIFEYFEHEKPPQRKPLFEKLFGEGGAASQFRGGAAGLFGERDVVGLINGEALPPKRTGPPRLVSLCIGVIGQHFEDIIEDLSEIAAEFPSDVKIHPDAGFSHPEQMALTAIARRRKLLSDAVLLSLADSSWDHLDVSGSSVTDLGLSEVAEMCPYLRAVDIRGCPRSNFTARRCLSILKPSLNDVEEESWEELDVKNISNGAQSLQWLVWPKIDEDSRHTLNSDCPRIVINPQPTLLGYRGSQVPWEALPESVLDEPDIKDIDPKTWATTIFTRTVATPNSASDASELHIAEKFRLAFVERDTRLAPKRAKNARQHQRRAKREWVETSMDAKSIALASRISRSLHNQI